VLGCCFEMRRMSYELKYSVLSGITTIFIYKSLLLASSRKRTK